MAKYIAHSSIDENGKIQGGKPGDQTGKEVCIRTWYASSWSSVLRLKDEKLRKQFANNMIDLANNKNVGYDQSQRNTLLTQAEKVKFDFTKVTTACECDCSSAITICILGAIYTILGESAYKSAKSILVAGSNCAYTGNIVSRLSNAGLITTYTSKDYTNSTDKAIFGDIYLKSSHIVCYIDEGKKVSVSTNTTTTPTPKPSTTQPSTNTTKVASADHYDKSIAGTYKTTADLNLRTDAGTNNKSLVIIPKGTTVSNYGYYSKDSKGVKWYYIQVTVNKVKYTGFSSSQYLKK